MAKIKVEYGNRKIEGEVQDVLLVINQFHKHIHFNQPIANNPPHVQKMMRDINWPAGLSEEVIHDGFECNTCGKVHPTPHHEEEKDVS